MCTSPDESCVWGCTPPAGDIDRLRTLLACTRLSVPQLMQGARCRAAHLECLLFAMPQYLQSRVGVIHSRVGISTFQSPGSGSSCCQCHGICLTTLPCVNRTHVLIGVVCTGRSHAARRDLIVETNDTKMIFGRFGLRKWLHTFQGRLHTSPFTMVAIKM